MIRYLFGRIAALWRPAAIPPRKGRSGTATARETQTMDAEMPAGGTGPKAGGHCGARQPGRGAARPRGIAAIAPDDLLARAMVALGTDFDRFAARERLLLDEMHMACATCHGRSRCRRDLGTGDFARRYRHYCPNAERLARIAAGTAAASKSPPPEHA